MKRIEIRTVLPVDYRKIKGFFITSGVLKLFYEVKNLEHTGNLSWIINGKYNAIVYFSVTDIVWEIYTTKNNKLKDKISVFLYPTGDDTGLNLKFETNRILPLRKSLESEVNSSVELLKSLLEALRKF
ncbi:hypothetical protein AAGT10_00615 [Sulfolobus tengchongensis]|jgi:hypothetical protein